MSDPILGLLTEISGRLGRVEGEIVAVKTEIGAVKETGEATHEQAVKTNGRVTVLEKASVYAAGAKAATTWIPKLAFAVAVSTAGGIVGATVAWLLS